MHLHLLPLSGEATPAATVAKKGKKINTIKTQEPDLAGEASTFSYRSYQIKTEQLHHKQLPRGSD